MSMLSVPLKTVLMYHADATGETLPVGYEYCDGRLLGIGTHDIGGGGSTYQLPDLRNRFILGADLTKGAGVTGGLTDSATDAPGPKGVGGLNGVTLATANLPSHTHTGTTGSNGAHTHAGSSVASAGAHTHSGSTSDSSGSHVHSINDPGHIHGLYMSTGTYGVASAMIMCGNCSDTSVNGFGIGSTLGGPAGTQAFAANAGTGISINAGGTHSHNLTIVSDGSHTHTVTVASDGAHTHSFTTDATGSATTVENRPRYYGLVFIMKVKL